MTDPDQPPDQPYGVEFVMSAPAQIRPPFPARAFEALAAVLSGVRRDPYGTTRHDGTQPSQAYRWGTFDDARGTFFLYLDEDRRELRVYTVVWLG